MKTMFRVMGMTILGLFLTLIMIQEVNIDIRKDELESISSLAMNQTQQVMEEQLEDQYYGTNNARDSINSDDEYFDLYVENFKKQISTNCVYDIERLNADYTKGLLDVQVTCKYYNTLGKEASITERKTNIIEQVDNASNIQSYTITYYLNKGHVSGKNPTKYSVLSEESTLTLKNPTRSGYEFIGWTGSGIDDDNPQMEVHIDKTQTENLVYIANWKTVTYTITYNANDSEVVHGKNYKAIMPNNPTTYTIETDTFTLAKPERPHYTFKGWTGSNGTTENTTVRVVRGMTGNRTYTANWVENTYGITYVMNDKGDGKGSSDAINTENLARNTKFTISSGDANDRIRLYNPTRVGYNFTGWTGDNVELINGVYYLTNISDGGDRTVYANWEAKTITVILSSDSENNATITKQYTYDSSEGSRTLAQPNQIFSSDNLRVGWNVAVNPSWESGNTIENNYIESVYNNNTNHTSTNKVLYKAKSVTLKFCGTDGDGSKCNTKTYYYNNNVYNGKDRSLLNNSTGQKFEALTKKNYTQMFWGGSNGLDYKNTGNKTYDLNYEVYNNWIVAHDGQTITIYAVWKPNIRYGYQTVTSWNESKCNASPQNLKYYNQGTQTNKSGQQTIYNSRYISDRVSGKNLKASIPKNFVVQEIYYKSGRPFYHNHSDDDLNYVLSSDGLYYEVEVFKNPADYGTHQNTLLKGTNTIAYASYNGSNIEKWESGEFAGSGKAENNIKITFSDENFKVDDLSFGQWSGVGNTEGNYTMELTVVGYAYEEKTCYFEPLTWSATTMTANEGTTRPTDWAVNKRLVWSDDAGNTWKVCDNDGTNCPYDF